MDELNEKGRLVCLMVATMASGVLANPVRVEREEPNMQALADMAMDFVRRVRAEPDFCEPDGRTGI